jgi:hypothetical protein
LTPLTGGEEHEYSERSRAAARRLGPAFAPAATHSVATVNDRYQLPGGIAYPALTAIALPLIGWQL